MERSMMWIRENPQLAAVAFAAAITALLLSFFAVTMTRAGLSLRPLIWFFGFGTIIAGPQAVVHLLDGWVLRNAGMTISTPGAVSAQAPGTEATRHPVTWETIFGPAADPALIIDARRGLGPVVEDASEAWISFGEGGTRSVLAARFASPAAAVEALDRYGRFFQVTEAQGSAAHGWTARRQLGSGDWVYAMTAGRELYAWTGPSREAVLAARERASFPVAPDLTVTEEKSKPPAPSVQDSRISRKLTANTSLMLCLLGVNLAAATGWFFKGTAWAARIDPVTAAQPLPPEDLRRALLALNDMETLPTQVERQPDGSLVVDWRYADARWLDLMHAHRMTHTHRLVLTLDETRRTVRVREYWSAFDASAGLDGLRLDWRKQTGIQFFQYNHLRVYGAQLDAQGRPTGELERAVTFDLQALKRPLIEAVTAAGWRWQPLAWDAPRPLRWLTE